MVYSRKKKEIIPSKDYTCDFAHQAAQILVSRMLTYVCTPRWLHDGSGAEQTITVSGPNPHFGQLGGSFATDVSDSWMRFSVQFALQTSTEQEL